MRDKPFCITFAGPVGSGKTPIAYYLSWNIGLPIFNNDAIRYEVIEDVGVLDVEVYLKRRESRLRQLLKTKQSFIYDASVDRRWGEFSEELSEANYEVFIISLDFNLEFLKQKYTRRGYQDISHNLKTFEEHQEFVKKYKAETGVCINNVGFDDRLEISLKGVKKWIKT